METNINDWLSDQTQLESSEIGRQYCWKANFLIHHISFHLLESFNSYVDITLSFFDYLPTHLDMDFDIFYPEHGQNSICLTTYPPHHVQVVFEWPFFYAKIQKSASINVMINACFVTFFKTLIGLLEFI